MSIIEVRGLSKSFEDRWVLSNVNFQVDEGDIFGYLGPNGAGKTTTMRIMLGLLKPTHGEALIRGRDMGTDGDMRKRVGVLLEKNGIYDRLTAHDNLQYFARLYGVDDIERRIKEQLELVGLSDRRDQKAGKFSKGMKQRLGLARAMIHDPEIMFLDEPSSGLDPEAQKMMRDIILEMSRKKKITVFLNSHNLDEVQRVCNRIAILQHGTIRAYDTVENMRSIYSRPMMEFTFKDEAMADKAQLVLAALLGEGGTFRKGLVTEAATDTVTPEELIERLVKNGIRVTEAKRMKRSLEEVYIDIIKQAGGGP
ncbi:MAG: ABC transporter ATP-binding protein [Methanomassiliicoccales archaeon]|jgi:ABC-2 type transport system ATP-binding protein